MSTTLTPPPPTAEPSAPAPGPARRPSSVVVAIVLIVLGALIVVGTIAGAVFSTIRSGSVMVSSVSAEVRGVDALDVELNAGALEIVFADVEEAELEVTGAVGADRWTLDRDGDTLEVRSPRWEWGMPWILGGSGRAVLTVPEDLQGLDLDMRMAAGAMRSTGDFGDLDVSVGAGELRLAGSADTVAVDLSAGGARLELADVRSATFIVSAGSMDADLTGTQPDDIRADVSAGSLTLVVPDGAYDVTSEVSAGEFRNRLGSDPGADSTISVQVSAGQVVLRSAR